MLPSSAFLALLLLSQVPPVDDEKAIRAAVEKLVRAVNDGEGEAFAGQFDVRRVLLEVRALGGTDPAGGDAPRLDRFEGPLRLALVQMGRQQKELAPWGELRQVSIRRAAGKPKAEVACVLRDADGERDRMRFWVAKEAEDWKVYDFESVNDGVRLTIVMAGFMTDVADPKRAAALGRAGRALQQATARLAAGELDEALADLRKVDPNVLPDSIASLCDMLEGGILYGQGKGDDALVALDRALRKCPDLPRAHQLRWEICRDLGRHADAAHSANEFLRILGDDSGAYLVLGLALRDLGRADEAVEAHRKGAACDDEDVANRWRLGILLALRKEPEGSRKTILDALARAGDEAPSVYGEVAEELMKLEDPAVLLDVARDQGARRKEDARPLYHEGHALRRLGRHEEAERVLRKGIEKDREDELYTAELREELACTLAHLGRSKEALEIADAIEEDDEGAALYVRAYLYAAAKAPTDALRALRGALKEDPDLHAKVEREAVFATLRSGEEGRALLAGAKAKSEFDGKAIDLMFSDRHEALRELSAARVKAAPEDADAWYHLGASLRKLGRHDQAEKALREGLRKETSEEDHPRFWEELGQALARGGRRAEALEWARKLLEAEDWVAEGHYVSALAHALGDDRKAALESLGKLLEADKDQLDEVEADPAFAELRKDPAYAALVRRFRDN